MAPSAAPDKSDGIDEFLAIPKSVFADDKLSHNESTPTTLLSNYTFTSLNVVRFC